MLLQFLNLAYLSVVALAITTNDCPSGLARDKYLKTHGQTCYKFVMNERKSFQDAEDYCKEDGGNLATVKSESLNNYLKNTLKSSYSVYYGSVWIGLRSSSQSYNWVDGSQMSFNHLDQTNLYTTSDECVALNPGEDTWLTYRCTGWVFFEETNRFICEYPVAKDTSSQSSNDYCPVTSDNADVIKSFGNKCYYFSVKERLTFKNAEAFCEKYGGRLALVKSEEINNFLEHEITQTHKLKYVSQSLWIGLRFTGSPRVLHWLDGTGLQYSKLSKYSTLYGNCVAIVPAGGSWRTHYCTDSSIDARRFICEFDKTSETTPKTTPKPVAKTTHGLILPTVPTRKPTSPASQNHGCPVTGSNVHTLDGKCYYFSINQRLSFQKAEAFCEKDGGTLALVKSQKINEFLQHHLLVTHKQGYRSEPLWIGLKYSKTFYAYRWVDGTSSLGYNNLESMSEDGECVAISGVDGEWEKQYCKNGYSAAKHFICEYNESQ